MSCEKEESAENQSQTKENQSQTNELQSNEKDETVHYYKETCREQYETCLDCCKENCQHDIEDCTFACEAAFRDCKSSNGSIANPFVHPPRFAFSIDKITSETERFEVRVDDNHSNFNNVEIQTGCGIYNDDGSFDYESSIDIIGNAEYDSETDQWVKTIELPLESINDDIDELGVEVTAKTEEGETYLGARLIDVE